MYNMKLNKTQEPNYCNFSTQNDENFLREYYLPIVLANIWRTRETDENIIVTRNFLVFANENFANYGKYCHHTDYAVKLRISEILYIKILYYVQAPNWVIFQHITTCTHAIKQRRERANLVRM